MTGPSRPPVDRWAPRADPWAQQRSLARVTVLWSVASVGAGAVVARRAGRRDGARRPPDWWRAFGRQHVGWGIVDLVVVALAAGLQQRRMARAGDPESPTARERERRALHRVLLINTLADGGYVVLGAVLARRPAPRIAGAGAAIVVQGAFLALHDGWHSLRSR